jgi:uncharacterized protein (TIGR02757 family)
MNKGETKALLDSWLEKYNHQHFIEEDPISVPHLFTRKEDIETSGFFSSILAWGQRKTSLKNTNRLMQIMEMQPYEFVVSAGKNELKALEAFVHRTFNGTDCITLVLGLRNIYLEHGGLEPVAASGFNKEGIFGAIEAIRSALLSVPHEKRTGKHLPSPAKGSAAKRINMYFRWMVRKDYAGIDFGIWNSIPASDLVCPLDVHTGRVARALGLLSDKNNSWDAACALTNSLKEFDENDPVKYDIALFCGGLFEHKGWIP